MYFVFGLLTAVAVIFVTGKIRPDLVALCALALLTLSGVLTPEETLKPFSSPVVLMIAALFVISEALSNVGISHFLGNYISGRVREGERNKLIRLLMMVVALLGSVMSSTGVVALFVPIVQRITTTLGMNPQRVFMPVAYAGLISGMMTLIAAAPNLIVNEELILQGHPGFEFLSFTPIGVISLVVAIAYFRLRGLFFPVQQHAENQEGHAELRKLFEKYELPFKIFRFELREDSPLEGQTLASSGMRKNFGINMIGVEEAFRGQVNVRTLDGHTKLRRNQIYYAYGKPTDIARFVDSLFLKRRLFTNRNRTILTDVIGFSEVIIPYDSPFIGRPATEFSREEFNNVTILASRRIKNMTAQNVETHEVSAGETLLVWGKYGNLRSLQRNSKWFIPLNQFGKEQVTELSRKAWSALIVVALMIITLITGVFPPVLAILGAAMLMVLTRCLSMEDAYNSVRWRTVVLIAAMLPFSVALDKTGGLEFISVGLASAFGGMDPHILLTAVFFISSILGMFISNAATAVIVAPIAISTAVQMNISPLPVAMTVAIACSAAFLTPLSSPVNMLVAAPGNYSLRDFAGNGLPLLLMIAAIAVGLIPLLFPFV